KALLEGMSEGLKGRSQLEAPSGWDDTFQQLMKDTDATVRQLSLALSVQFGDPAALDEMRQTLTDLKQPVTVRRGALDALVNAHDKKLPGVLRLLLADGDLRGPVLRAIAAFDDAPSSGMMIEVYSTLSTAEKRDAIATLAARKSYAQTLLKAIGDKKIPAG